MVCLSHLNNGSDSKCDVKSGAVEGNVAPADHDGNNDVKAEVAASESDRCPPRFLILSVTCVWY